MFSCTICILRSWVVGGTGDHATMPTNDRFANGGSQGKKRRAEDAASNGSSRPRLELEKEQVARHILSLCIVSYCRAFPSQCSALACISCWSAAGRVGVAAHLACRSRCASCQCRILPRDIAAVLHAVLHLSILISRSDFGASSI